MMMMMIDDDDDDDDDDDVRVGIAQPLPNVPCIENVTTVLLNACSVMTQLGLSLRIRSFLIIVLLYWAARFDSG